MRCLLIYYSLTGQAERAVELAQVECAAQGWEAVLCRVDFADPAERLARPLSVAATKKWVSGAKRGMTLPVLYEPAGALAAHYDLVLIFSNTWAGNPCVPIRSFMENVQARSVLAGRKFGVFIICRRLWKDNLTVICRLGESAQGTFIGGEAFTHSGSQAGSLIQTISYIMRRGAPLKGIPGFRLPAYGLSAAALSRVPAFTRDLLADAQTASEPPVSSAS
jgi:flavodoxin